MVAEADLPGFGVAMLVVEDTDYVLVVGFVFGDEHVLVRVDVLEGGHVAYFPLSGSLDYYLCLDLPNVEALLEDTAILELCIQ